MAFPGLKNGEQECDVFFCTVHVMRTWMSKIYEKKTRQKMLHAMHKRTRIGCESLIQEAINECANPTIKKYILRNYAKNTHQWALWARQHSPLLLQVTSTNALESYHSELKRTTSPKHGLIGNCLCIFNKYFRF
jgi:transposase-like protein